MDAAVFVLMLIGSLQLGFVFVRTMLVFARRIRRRFTSGPRVRGTHRISTNER